jgi:hypothetical protein
MTAPKKYPHPEGLQLDALYDAHWDLVDNDATTLPPDADPEVWIYWLKRHYGVDGVTVRSHTDTALILERL